MSKEYRANKLALLFEEAVELATPEEQAGFLDRACAGDSELRRQVDQLLRAHREAGGFLRSDAGLEAGASSDWNDEGAGASKPGDWLGPYHLLGLVGEGGSSTVYLAEQEKPVRRWVALKVLKAGMDTQRIIARFELERQALAVMDHPGIAKVLDAGATPSGRPFFVMELVRGLAITRHCDEHRLSIPQRLELFIQVCQAVLHAHQKGIVHRDIKPENILVSLHDGRAFPKVIDFGIAKVLHAWTEEKTPITGGMPFLGTPAYMSPEQARMTMPDLDTRTDIYSLGALLHELLVSHPPFDHHTLMAAGLDEMCRIIRFQEPGGPLLRFEQLPLPEQSLIARARRTSPEELRRTIVGDLEWITLKAIEKDREQRYGSAANLAEDIHRHLQNLPVSVAAPTLRYRFSKMVRRNRKVVLSAVVVGAILLGSAVFNAGMAARARSSAKRAQSLQVAAVAAERESHRALVAMHVSSGLAAAGEGNFDRAALWFANAAQAAGRDTPDYALNLRRAAAWLQRSPAPSGAFQLSSTFAVLEFSATSQYLLAVDRNGSFCVWDCDARGPLAWPQMIGRVNAVAWHPNGLRLALALGNNVIQIRNLPDGSVLQTIRGTEEIRAVSFSNDGEYLVFGSRTVRALHLRTGLEKAWPHPEPVIGFGFTSQADLIVTVCLDGAARVLSLTDDPTGPIKAPAATHRPSIRVDSCSSKTTYRQEFLEVPVLSVPALAAKGKLLVTRTGAYEISIWEVGTASLIRRFDEMCCSCRFVMSADGTRLAGGLHGGRVAVWDIASGRQVALLTSSGACNLDVALAPAGDCMLTAEANGVARLWSVSKGKQIHPAMHHSAEVDKVAFASKGDRVATAQADGLVRVWTLPRANPKGHLIASDPGPKVMRLDPERRHFVAVREPAWKAEIRTATICSAETGTPVGQTLELSGNLEDVALSPGCRQAALAFGAGDDDTTGFLEFRDIRTGRVHGRTPLASAASSLAWDPNGDRIAAICHSGQLLIACPGSNAPVTWAQPLESAPMQVHPFVAFTPEGSSLISLTPAGALEVREAATGQLRYPALRAEPIGFWNFAVSRDGQILASTTRSGRVDVWNVQTGVRQGDPLYHPGWVYRCSFSADGTLLVTACHDGRSRVWDLRSGQQSGQPLAHPKEVYDAVFTPDGRWVLTASRDGGIRFWDWQSGGMVAPPFKVGDQAFTIDITADGQYAVIGSLDSTIHVLCLGLLKEKIPWGGSELRLLAEVVSGSVVARGMIRELTTAEWLQGARELRKIRPELLPPWWNPPVAISAKNACPRAVDSVAGAVDKAASAAACPNSSACGNKDCPSSAQPKDQLPL